MITQPSEAGEHPIHEALLAAPPVAPSKREETERDEDDRWSDLPCTD